MAMVKGRPAVGGGAGRRERTAGPSEKPGGHDLGGPGAVLGGGGARPSQGLSSRHVSFGRKHKVACFLTRSSHLMEQPWPLNSRAIMELLEE
jgi:hypothetical protein